MSHWNYRVCRETITYPDGGTDQQYSLREVYYDDKGNPKGWSEPVTFEGDHPEEVVESLRLAIKACISNNMLDLETRETIPLMYHRLPAFRRNKT